MIGLVIATALACLLLLAGCERKGEHSAELFVFGTIVELKLWGVTGEEANEAFADIQRMFQDMHSDWHAWEPGMLTGINQAFTEGRTATANEDIIEMIRHSQEAEKKTGGRFNASIGGLIRLWGFHTSDYPIQGPPPSQEQIDKELVSRPSSLDIYIDGLTLRSDNPAVQLDFGGIAKGHAVDLTIERLKSRGIENAIVNAGGDLRAMGSHGNRPWRVAVRQPGGGMIGTIEVDGDESIFTSGNYERFREDKTERYPHILDPRTGWPARDIAAVTIITDKGIIADAAATALIVAGLKDWPDVARAMGLNKVAVVDEEGTVYLSPDMQSRIEFSADSKRVIVSL